MRTTLRRVGLYGGSFDPPHHGHLLLVAWALAAGNLDEIWFLPAAGHAFGKQLSPFALRCEMLTLASQHLGARARVETIEDALPKPSYTIDTLRALTAREGSGVEFTWLMGSDTYHERHKWKAWADIERLLGGRILVVGRSGYHDESVEPAVTLPGLSSSELRAACKDGAAPPWYLVSDEVAALITREGLYQA